MKESAIIIVVIFAVVMGMMLYSLFLQKIATKKYMQSLQESVERQREAIQLQKESNELLKQIVENLKGKKDT